MINQKRKIVLEINGIYLITDIIHNIIYQMEIEQTIIELVLILMISSFMDYKNQNDFLLIITNYFKNKFDKIIKGKKQIMDYDYENEQRRLKEISDKKLLEIYKENILEDILTGKINHVHFESIYNECIDRNLDLTLFFDETIREIERTKNKYPQNKKMNSETILKNVKKEVLKKFKIETQGTKAWIEKTSNEIKDILIDPNIRYINVYNDSMEGIGIYNDQIVATDITNSNYNNNIVVVKYKDELLIKNYMRSRNKVILRSENDKYDDIEITDENEIEIFGVVQFGIMPL